MLQHFCCWFLSWAAHLRLQIAYYDQEIIKEIASRTQLSEDYIQRISERKPFVSYPIHIGHSFYPIIDPAVHNSVQIFAE